MSETHDNNKSIVPQELSISALKGVLSSLSPRQQVVIAEYIKLLYEEPTPKNQYYLKLFWDLLEDRLTLDEYFAFRADYDIDNPYEGGAK